MLSFSLSPAFPVFRMRSDPARSTKWNLEERICRLPPVARKPPRRCSMMAAVCRAVFPDSKRLNTSSSPSTSHSFTPHRTMGKNRKDHFHMRIIQGLQSGQCNLDWIPSVSCAVGGEEPGRNATGYIPGKKQ
uniref:Uncharacterized protein n=1 Tax=Astyanax mexicanus TaxID=7994 RepID=A0A3B1KD17_ASTMX